MSIGEDFEGHGGHIYASHGTCQGFEQTIYLGSRKRVAKAGSDNWVGKVWVGKVWYDVARKATAASLAGSERRNANV